MRSLGLLIVAFLGLMLIGVLGVAGVPVSAQQMPGHGEHGTPKEWKFTWPKGDPAKGREVFAKLECYSCHEVKGEKFPAPSEPGKVGPGLSQMGPLHDPEYFAEALINPSAVIEPDKGYAAADGSSKMPSFNDSATVQGIVDLVAFLRNLKPQRPGVSNSTELTFSAGSPRAAVSAPGCWWSARGTSCPGLS